MLCDRYRRNDFTHENLLAEVIPEDYIPPDETLTHMMEQSSGSGSGLPLLVRYDSHVT